MTSKPGCRQYFKTAETYSERVPTFADVKCQVLTVEKSMGVEKQVPRVLWVISSEQMVKNDRLFMVECHNLYN